ncbi:unnamed protein product [Effrenium voratum]|nr:unnamed protein product [Effrenium voratum]
MTSPSGYGVSHEEMLMNDLTMEEVLSKESSDAEVVEQTKTDKKQSKPKMLNIKIPDPASINTADWDFMVVLDQTADLEDLCNLKEEVIGEIQVAVKKYQMVKENIAETMAFFKKEAKDTDNEVKKQKNKLATLVRLSEKIKLVIMMEGEEKPFIKEFMKGNTTGSVRECACMFFFNAKSKKNKYDLWMNDVNITSHDRATLGGNTLKITLGITLKDDDTLKMKPKAASSEEV